MADIPLTADTTDLEVINEEKESLQLLTDTQDAKEILQLIEDYHREEEYARIDLTRKCRKHMHYWNNFQYLAWDDVAHDWRTPNEIVESDPDADIDPADYAKIANVYKAHGEILIGALTAGMPSVRFFPNDADDPDDITTAKAFTKLAEILSKYNEGKLLLMKALFILYNQGMLACYNENKTDFRFGSVKYPEYGNIQVPQQHSYCPSCGEELTSGDIPSPMSAGNSPQGGVEAPVDPLNAQVAQGQENTPVAPSPQSQPPQGMPEPLACPNCQNVVIPEQETQMEDQTVQTGEKYAPKNRECLEIYGPLNVRFPLWCKDQASMPYLTLQTDEDSGLMKQVYDELYDRISGTTYSDLYEREARVPTAYKFDLPQNLLQVNRTWLRPWAFNRLAKDRAKYFKNKYPEGCYVVHMENGLVAEIIPDKLDDHWTIAEHPLAETLHPEPIGASMVPMQDITNELLNLTLETVEFGIPEIFADPAALDFEEYDQKEARPGNITPAKAPSGQNLSGAFHEIKASTVSREIDVFGERVQSLTQLVMGSYPSIYGGPQEGGGDTAREYELSKASALQRLTSTWTIVQFFWAKVMKKSVLSHARNMKTDEKVVTAKGSSFINVWVRKADLNGEIADLEPEVSESFPVSWTQKRDVILNLIQMQNEDIAAVIRHPENAGLIAEMIGVPELYIPGDDDRSKQLAEIAILIRTEPMMGQPDPMTGQPNMQSSVPITPDLDNNEVESEVCKAWLISEVGQDAKVNNPGGYANVLAHKKEHDMAIQQQAVQRMMQEAQAAAGAQGGSEDVGQEGVQPEGATA